MTWNDVMLFLCCDAVFCEEVKTEALGLLGDDVQQWETTQDKSGISKDASEWSGGSHTDQLIVFKLDVHLQILDFHVIS